MRPLVILSALLPALTFAQNPSKQDTVRREAVINHHTDENKINFSVTAPPLQQIPGAPKAFYEFYWEFGDGDYGNGPEPYHHYKKPGEYEVRLWTTNNYDNGKPPPSRPQKVQVKKITYDYEPALPENDVFEIKNNREPVPEEEMVAIVTYKNESVYPASGKLYIFFNEKKFRADNFSLLETRTYHGERTVQDDPPVVANTASLNSSLLWASAKSFTYSLHDTEPEVPLKDELDQSRADYRNVHVLEFDGMAPGETRNIFYSFVTTPEMIKDTSAIVKIKGVYIPERNGKNYHKKEMEMEVVTSHDPNKMSVSDTRLNYRRYKNKILDFKIRFQNNGEGPARSIRLNVDVPDMYDKHSLKILDLYPPCAICTGDEDPSSCLDTIFTSDKIIFHFRNIYLPGSDQDNVDDYDSTKGFVKYSLKFNPSAEKKKTVSRTAIVFDKNEPVITNYATTRFKAGLSIGIKAGYTYFSHQLSGDRSFFAGITFSPYRPRRGYFQVEAMTGSMTYSDGDSLRLTTLIPLNDATGVIGVYDLYETVLKTSYEKTSLNLVPISYRYTLTGFLALGAGVQINAISTRSAKRNGTSKHYIFYEQENIRRRITGDSAISSETKGSGFTEFRAGVFGDLIIGSARIGPALGVRYTYFPEDSHVQFQLYAQCKF